MKVVKFWMAAMAMVAAVSAVLCATQTAAELTPAQALAIGIDAYIFGDPLDRRVPGARQAHDRDRTGNPTGSRPRRASSS